MRLSLLLALLLALTAPVRSAEAEFLHVWPAWREAEAFDRISEYFGGGENQGNQRVLRTQPAAREGYYFLARIRSASAHPGVIFELSVIRPDSPEPKVFRLASELPAGDSVVQVGLTGPDWPGGARKNPTAWKLALLGAEGRVLAEQKSFLWEKPAK